MTEQETKDVKDYCRVSNALEELSKIDTTSSDVIKEAPLKAIIQSLTVWERILYDVIESRRTTNA